MKIGSPCVCHNFASTLRWTRVRMSRMRVNMMLLRAFSKFVQAPLYLPACSNRFSPLAKGFYSSSIYNMAKKALLVITDGAEEMEAVITADVLRRAEIDVTIAGLNSNAPVKCSRNVVIVPDVALKEVELNSYDAFVLPGGMNAAKSFAQSQEVGDALKKYQESGKLIAVICASPIALAAHSIGQKSTKLTSHPSVSGELVSKYTYSEERVVIDGLLITSRGPGTAFEFALAIVNKLVGQEKVNQISPPMILK